MSGRLREQIDQAGRAYRQRRYEGDLAAELLGEPVESVVDERGRGPWVLRFAAWGGAGLGIAAAVGLVLVLRAGPDGSNDHAGGDPAPVKPVTPANGGVAAAPDPVDDPTPTDPQTTPERVRQATASRSVVPPSIDTNIRRFSFSRPSLAKLKRQPQLSRGDRSPMRLTRPALRSTSRPVTTPQTPTDAPAPGATRWPSTPSPVETS